MTRYPDIAWREKGEADRIVEHMDSSGVAWALNVRVPWHREEFRFANH